MTEKLYPKNTKHYFHFVILSVLFAVICIPTAGKTVDILGVPLSVSIFYFPLIYVVADILTEVYGYALARRALWYSIIGQIITMAIFQFVAWMPPSTTLSNNESFVQILSQAPIFVLVGTIAVFVGDVVNNYVLAKMKIKSKGKNMAARFVVSTAAGEFTNTFIFYFFALVLTGIIPMSVAFYSILLGAILKIGIEIVFLPLTIWVTKKIKEIEGIDVFDIKTDFNPLKF